MGKTSTYTVSAAVDARLRALALMVGSGDDLSLGQPFGQASKLDTTSAPTLVLPTTKFE